MSRKKTGAEPARLVYATDSPADFELVRSALENEGFELDHVSSSQELLAMLSDRDCDLVLSDSAFPDLKTGGILDLIGGQHPSLPVIIVSGHGSEIAVLDAWRQGAVGYLPCNRKDLQQLPSLIREALAQTNPGSHPHALADQAVARSHERQQSLLLGKERRDRGASLRARAVELLARAPSDTGREHKDSVRKLVYELEVFQTELELQNDQLRRTELDLTEARDRYQELFDSAPVGYLTIGENGVIQEANQTAATMLGKAPDHLLGAKLSDFVHRDDQDALHLHRQELIAAGGSKNTWHLGAKVTSELRLGAAGGQWHPVQVDSWSVIEGSETETFRTTLTDITERKRVEEELREAMATLEQAQNLLVRQERLRAVGQMASGAAHDLNNALSPVLGYASLLLEEPSLSAMAKEWAELIRGAAADAAAVVGCLAEFSGDRRVGLPQTSIDLLDLMGRIPEFTRPKWQDEALEGRSRITVETDLRRVPLVAGVEAELRQVVTNLVFNAVEALPNGGQITLRSYTNQGSACLEVSDDGVGMTEEERQLCFEPFFSGKAGGGGLGLSVCYGIVKRHQGEMAIESEPGKGTLFRVTLPPFDKPASTDASSPAAAAPAAPLPRGRILYIDDDARVRPLLQALLERLGQTVVLAEGGASGLELIEAEKFDAIITDMGMPNVDGLQVVRAVRERHPGLPVVMLSGWSESLALKNVDEQWRPTAFLQKPASIPMLKAVLASVLGAGSS